MDAPPFFAGREDYRTDPGTMVDFLSGACLGLRLPFLLFPRILDVVFSASRKATRGIYDDREWIKSSEGVVRALEAAGGRFEITGLGKIRRDDGPVVFVANHMSILETFVLPCLIASVKPVSFVVKENLLTFPIFGPVMRSRNPIPVGRVKPREDYAAVMEGGSERLRRGISLIIFPQTTRSVSFDPAGFNSLGVKLARRAGVPVQPVALKTDAWRNGKRLKDFGRLDPRKVIRICFGELLPVEGAGAAEHAAVVAFIKGRLSLWAGQDG